MKKEELALYRDLIGEIKVRVRRAQSRAALSANAEMILMYWEIGRLLIERQSQEGWGTGVLPRIAADLKNELPEVNGFSERNLGHMIRFAREYGPPPILQQAAAKLTEQQDFRTNSGPAPLEILQQSAAKLQRSAAAEPIPLQLAVGLPWFHHVVLIQRVKDLPTRLWYARQAFDQGWTRDTLTAQIKARAHERHGAAVTNFDRTLPAAHAEIASQLLKDPYVFDFLTLDEPFRERELETGLLHHLQKFLLELGRGFAFVGSQYPLEVGD